MSFTFFFLTIVIFFILLIFVFPRLLYFSVLLYHAFKKDNKKGKFKSYKLRDLKEIR